MKKFDGQIRQGDVLLHAFDGDIPKGAKIVEPQNGRYILAEGEVTGHAHVITDNDSEVVLRLLANKVASHPENPVKAIKEELKSQLKKFDKARKNFKDRN